MQLNKNSWHARYYGLLVGGKLPEGICEYVRSLIFQSLLIFFIVCMLFLVCYSAGLKATLMGLGIIVGVVLLSLSWFKIFDKFDESKTWKLFAEYVKAKKNNWCPRIEWK